MTLDAQQSALPFGPQAAATPTQLARGPQVCVVALHAGVVPLQSALPRQATQLDAAPVRLHRGVLPVHAVQLGPQLVSAPQVAHVPEPHTWLLPHAVSTGA
jgi:hypothetical protein